VALIVAVKGIIQSYDADEMLLNAGRVVSTIGNANQLSSYLMTGFFVVGLWVNEWVLPMKITKPTLFYILSSVAFLLLVIYMICLLKTSTRGSLIALVLGGGAMIFLTFLKTTSLKLKGILSVIMVLFVMTVAGLFYFRNTHFIQQNSTLNRVTRITDGDGTNTLKSRLENYKIAVEAIKEKPFLGWGQETYHYAYAKHFNPALYADATWYDRVHNIILEWLVIGGLLGLLVYLFLWGGAIYQLWWGRNSLSNSAKIIISGYLVAYFVSNLSLFDNLLSLMIFVVFLGFINYSTNAQPIGHTFNFSKKIIWVASSIIVIVMVLLIKFTCKDAYQTNKAIANAYNAGSLDEVVTNYQQAYTKATIGRQEVAEQIAILSADVNNSPLPDETKNRYFTVARQIMATEVAKHPTYARLQIIYGNLLEAQGDNQEAISVFEKVKELSPKRQSSLRQLAMLYAKNKQYKQANDLLEQTYHLAPQNEEPKVYQAVVWAMQGDTAKVNRIVFELGDKELNSQLALVKYAFSLNNDMKGFLAMCKQRFLGNINTLPTTYQLWANTAFEMKEYVETATAVYAFRRHFAGEKHFMDVRDAHLMTQEIMQGKNPAFAFEKTE
jgi:O-antigen ligase